MEDVIKYIIDNLEVNIQRATEFGPVEIIKVTLEIDGNVISESSCDLPELNK